MDFYEHEGICYDVNFPREWAESHLPNTGPIYCSNCSYYGTTQNGLFVMYCRNCALYNYQGTRGKGTLVKCCDEYNYIYYDMPPLIPIDEPIEVQQENSSEEEEEEEEGTEEEEGGVRGALPSEDEEGGVRGALPSEDEEETDSEEYELEEQDSIS